MPRILSYEEVEKYLNLIRSGEGLTKAARRLGIDPRHFRDARKANPEFDELVRLAETEAAEPVESALYTAATNGEPWAVKLWLERRSSERWGPPPTTFNVNHGVDPGVGKLIELTALLEQRKAMLGLSSGADVLDVEAVD